MPLLRTIKKNLFAPPYRWLPLAVFAFFALSAALHPQSSLRMHQLFDTDDYMRLNEVINWMQSAHPFGKAWYDLSQPRLSPGEHVVVHWARLVDVPLALFALPFIPALGIHNAVLASAFIVPPLLFALLLYLLPILAQSLVGERRANLSTLMVLFAPTVLVNFLPGRADHHDYGMLIAICGLICLQRIVLRQHAERFAFFAAIAFACGLWIGTESLPWLILFTAYLGLIGAWRGEYVLRHAAIFGAALPLAVAAVMPLALPHMQYFTRALSWFSGADFIFALLAAMVLIGGWFGGRFTNNRTLRLGLMAALGSCAALAFVALVPDILVGAYADYDRFFNFTLLSNIGEAQPLIPSMHVSIYTPVTYVHAGLMILHTIFLPCVAAITVIWNLFCGRRSLRPIWLMYGFFLLPALLMTMFWQVRVVWFAQIFSLVPITWLAGSAWDYIDKHELKRQPRVWAKIFAFILIAPLPIVLLPAIISKERIVPDLLFYPATRAANKCPLVNASNFINQRYSDRSYIILAGVNEGPELMFRTPHSVLAAPYNVDGNSDAFKFFNARSDRPAVEVMARRHVDLVLVCKHIPNFYADLETYKQRFHAYFYMDAQGHLQIRSSRDHPTLIERLAEDDVPAWLKQVDIPGDKNYFLFEANY